MQLSTLFLTALVATGAIADSYEIKLYENSGCHLLSGEKCSGLSERQCCYSSSHKQFQSGRFTEGGFFASSNQLNLYEDACTGSAVQHHTGNGCLAHSSKTVIGAQILSAISLRDESKLAPPPEPVEADESFLEEGDYIYTIKRNTTAGQALELLTRWNDRAEHFRTFGKRELLENEE